MLRILKRFLIGILTLVGLLIITFFILRFLPLPTPFDPGDPMESIVIKNVNVVDIVGDSILQSKTIIISDGHITAVTNADSLSLSPDNLVIDAVGKYIIPGLWDMHVHMGSRYAPQLVFPLFIAGGVTGVRDLGGGTSASQKKAWHSAIERNQLVGPRILGQASFVLASMDSVADVPETVELVEGPNDFIKVYNQLLPEHYFALTDHAGNEGVTILGHKPRAVNAIEASKAGHRSFEHARLFLFECFPGAEELRRLYYNVYTGSVEHEGRVVDTKVRREMIDQHDASMFDSLVSTMIENDTWFCPTHITRKMDAMAHDKEYREDDRLKYIHFLQRMFWHRDADGMVDEDPSEEGRQSYMDFYLKGLELTGKAYKAGVKVIAGTDANDTYSIPGLGIHDELVELVKAGLSPAEALRTATINTAEYFNLESEYGSIDVGKRADLLLLDSNPLIDISNTADINSVIINSIVYDRNDLDGMLKYIRKNAGKWSLGVKIVVDEMGDGSE